MITDMTRQVRDGAKPGVTMTQRFKSGTLVALFER